MKSILIYKIISKVYDLLDIFYFRHSNMSPRTAVNRYLGYKKLEILDICTGTAANAISIVKMNPNAKVTGIDISRDMLKIAKKKFRNLNYLILTCMKWTQQIQNFRMEYLISF